MSRYLALFACFLAPVAAMATDLPNKKSAPAFIETVSSENWTGFRGGVFAGGAVGSTYSKFEVTDNVLDYLALGDSGSTDLHLYSGLALGGVRGSFDKQYGRFVVGVGLDATIRPRSSSASVTEIYEEYSDTLDLSWRRSWGAALRARAGYLLNDYLLAYATAGVAVGKFEYKITEMYGIEGANPNSFSQSDTDFGLIIGVGTELKFANRWSAYAEYFYSGFGKTEISNDGNVERGPSYPVSVTTIDQNAHEFMIGLNYWL